MNLQRGIGIWLVVVLTYMLTEQSGWITHHPRYEFFFWLLAVTSLFDLLFLADNSPIPFLLGMNSNLNPLNVALICGIISPLLAAGFVESINATRLKKFQIGKARDDIAHVYNKNDEVHAGEHKVRQVNDLLSRVVHNSQVRTFAAWLRGRLEQNRQQIHDVIVESTPKELDHIISTVNLPKLFTYGNHYVKAQQELGYSTLQYILEQREKDLTIFARAALIHGLMRMSTIKYSKQQMRWATQTFLGAKGEDLTLLKSLLDSSGDYNNLFKLVFIDVTDEKMHKQILSHIHRQAKEQIRLDRAEKKKRIKILSDVDDTLIASGGRFPAGAETRFPRHVLYPGALALFEEIDVASRLSGRPVSSSRRKSIKRLSKQRRKEGEDDGIIDENYNDEDFEHDMSSVYGPEDDDLQNDHAKNLSEMVKVSITLPWKKGGGVHHLLFNASDPISSIQDTIENDYGLPPWKQNLIIQPASSFETRQSWKHGNVAFLSARPHAYKDLTESGSYRKFAKLFATGLMHATPTLLPGSLRSGSAAIMVKIRDQILIYGLDLYDVVTALGSTLAKRTSRKKLRRDRDAVEEDDDEENLRDALITKMSTFGTRQTTNDNWIPVAETKVDRFEKYSRLYPEYGFVFFGDNGQGDLYSAERMCVSKYASKRMHKSFIHRVMPKGSESTLLSSLKKSERNAFWKENNIVFFDTYIGAAIEALESKLIPVRGLYRVAKRGVEEMETLLEDYPAFNFEEAVKHLNKDIDRANEKLAEHGMDPVDGILAY